MLFAEELFDLFRCGHPTSKFTIPVTIAVGPPPSHTLRGESFPPCEAPRCGPCTQAKSIHPIVRAFRRKDHP